MNALPSELPTKLNVNHQAIADGLYEIICQRGQESIVAFGMIPADLMEMTRKMICEKVISENARIMSCQPEDITPHVDKALMDGIVNPIVHQISVGIYAAAKRAGKMIV